MDTTNATATETSYTMNESWGSDAHTIATRVSFDALPAHAQAAILAAPDADSWTVPSLDGARLMDDLDLVIVRDMDR